MSKTQRSDRREATTKMKRKRIEAKYEEIIGELLKEREESDPGPDLFDEYDPTTLEISLAMQRARGGRRKS